MKEILIITYYWPPSAGSGVQRWLKFSKYLPDFGFKPTIYTPENPHYHIFDDGLLEDVHPDVRVIKKKIWEPYALADFLTGKKGNNQGMIQNSEKQSLKSKFLNFIRANFFIPDPRVHWVKPSIKYLKQYIDKNNIEYLITTGPPHSMHLIGLGLKKTFPQLKWIVDIRDPWSTFDFLKTYNSSKKALQKQADLESKVLNNCDLVLGTSYSMKDMLVSFNHDKYHTITNGYDQKDFIDFKNTSSPGKLVIYHGGLINQLRNPVNLWEAFDQVCARNPDFKKQFKIHLAGTIDPSISESLDQLKHLKDNVFIEGYKKHNEIIMDYASADILLLLVNNSDNAKANIPGKLFEYIATGKPIILVAPKGTDAEAILKGYHRFQHYEYEARIENIKELKDFLLSAKVSVADEQFKNKFERKSLTKNLVLQLESL